MTDNEPLECLDRNEKCSGSVEMQPAPPYGEKFFPRCAFHSEKRWEKFENGIEREALSDVPPAWFDPGYAGEEW